MLIFHTGQQLDSNLWLCSANGLHKDQISTLREVQDSYILTVDTKWVQESAGAKSCTSKLKENEPWHQQHHQKRLNKENMSLLLLSEQDALGLPA